eukprot:s880_g24.t1
MVTEPPVNPEDHRGAALGGIPNLDFCLRAVIEAGERWVSWGLEIRGMLRAELLKSLGKAERLKFEDNCSHLVKIFGDLADGSPNSRSFPDGISGVSNMRVLWEFVESGSHSAS